MVDDADVASAGGGVGAEMLSRAVSDRYEDQRGPLMAADLQIPDWLNADAAFTGMAASGLHDDDTFVRPSTSGLTCRKKATTSSAASSRYGSASSLSVKSGGEEENEGEAGMGNSGVSASLYFGGIPSPDVASALFADAMGHAADASLGDSQTKIDLGLDHVDSPEVARSEALPQRHGHPAMEESW